MPKPKTRSSESPAAEKRPADRIHDKPGFTRVQGTRAVHGRDGKPVITKRSGTDDDDGETPS